MNLRLLLLEDDAVSAAFLREALAALPARVDHAPDVASARRLAGSGHDLWIFDARLPDGHGADLLAELRACGLQVPAVALTAEDEPLALQRLETAGFLRVLRKPVRVPDLHANVRALLPRTRVDAPWDDAVAHAALGQDAAAVQALRRLFLQELPMQARAVADACRAGDPVAAREHLHRLKAGCGFVGAMRLLAAVRVLASAPGDEAALGQFVRRAGELSAGA
ncbi:response regulator transcription factor [Arenimonas daejeonensis]|uniref:response regulator transcription factor n=1 Tax=Arenimonas daejeonensis TaxID=370777 RepID=UPI0011BE186E|nr:response regulator [Arenimonas daejeonensis]